MSDITITLTSDQASVVLFALRSLRKKTEKFTERADFDPEMDVSAVMRVQHCNEVTRQINAKRSGRSQEQFQDTEMLFSAEEKRKQRLLRIRG